MIQSWEIKSSHVTFITPGQPAESIHTDRHTAGHEIATFLDKHPDGEYSRLDLDTNDRIARKTVGDRNGTQVTHY